MGYQTYKTKAAAQAEIEKMKGWPNAKAIQLYLPDDENADKEGCAWGIKSGGNYYLRVNGYVK